MIELHMHNKQKNNKKIFQEHENNKLSFWTRVVFAHASAGSARVQVSFCVVCMMGKTSKTWFRMAGICLAQWGWGDGQFEQNGIYSK